MKTLLLTVLALFFVGCASDPMMTGKPQDWKGKPAANLRSAMGHPTRIIHQGADVQIWEYVKTGEFVAPKENKTSFNLGGFGSGGGAFSGFGASGGIRTTEQGERLSTYENILRYKVKKGKIIGWSAARIVDGATVWSDH